MSVRNGTRDRRTRRRRRGRRRESKLGESESRCDHLGRAMATGHRATRRRDNENETAVGKPSGERRGPGTYPGAPELKAGPPSHLELATFQRPPNCEPPQVAEKPFTSPLVVDSSRRRPASTGKYKISRHPEWRATRARTWRPDAGKIPRRRGTLFEPRPTVVPVPARRLFKSPENRT
jgi:hypothetical protein